MPTQCGVPDAANNNANHCDVSEMQFNVPDCEGNPSGATCSCHETCALLGDCCHDYVAVCNAGERMPMATTSIPATAPPSCEDFKCAKECGVSQSLGLSQFSNCGWSSKKQQCVKGGKTSKKELQRNECSSL